MTLKNKMLISGSVLALFMSLSNGRAIADDTTSQQNQQLLKKMDAMEKRIQMLETELNQKNSNSSTTPKSSSKQQVAPSSPLAISPKTSLPEAKIEDMKADSSLPPATPAKTRNKDLFGLVASPIDGLKIGMYGELKLGTQQNPDADGHWQSGFDAARIVLLPSYQFTDNIVFNAEIEFEHAGTGFDADDKLHGTAEIEQAYVDFKISPYLNIRSPGIDLVPISYNNLYHEPTLFYSVNRPELANGLIPTTWTAASAGVYGKIIDNLTYQFQVSSGLEDFGDDYGTRTDANTVPDGPYAAGISGKDALGVAKAPLGDFRQLTNSVAETLRLAYTPSFIPGFAGSTAFYYTPNTTPRGAHDDLGNILGHSSLAILDSEFRYRVPKTGLELRGEYAQTWFGNSANLRANNDSDPENNVGSTMYGISGEVAYHFPIGQFLKSKWEAVPFYRYTFENLQSGGFQGTDSNEPTGSSKTHFHTFGVAIFPTPQLVLKLNYQKVLNNEEGGAKSDSFLTSLGFFF